MISNFLEHHVNKKNKNESYSSNALNTYHKEKRKREKQKQKINTQLFFKFNIAKNSRWQFFLKFMIKHGVLIIDHLKLQSFKCKHTYQKSNIDLSSLIKNWSNLWHWLKKYMAEIKMNIQEKICLGLVVQKLTPSTYMSRIYLYKEKFSI